MNSLFSKLNPIDRRQFVEYAARSMLGVSMIPMLERVVSAQTATGGKAKRLIYLFMNGAMTHIDTFDLKPGHPNQGDTKPINTSVPGLQISQFLPKLASQFDKLAVIRSMHTQTADHEAGEYLMRTSYEEIATERHPSLGPWIQNLKGRQNKTLPDTVLISAPARHPGPGFFDPSFSPLPIGDPNRGLENTTAPQYLTDESFDKRITLINGFDRKFREKFKVKKVQSYTDFYSEATSLLTSGELKAFDLNNEKNEDRDRYGRDAFGEGCLLARRLIENNVRCVEVSCGGWDMHSNIYNGGTLPARADIMDRAVGALLKDLSDRGLLDETLVVLTTEFGRTPPPPRPYYGKSDDAGASVADDGVAPADFNATIATALGLPLDKVVFSPTGRPFKVAHDGVPIAKLLS